MDNDISIKQFIQAIKRLPSDSPVDNPRVWYRTQKQHWLGWLGDYDSPGAYGRKNFQKRNAKFAYNHIVCPELLLYLIRAIPLSEDTIQAAESAAESGATLMQKAGAIRKIVPWNVIVKALWPSDRDSDSLVRRVLLPITRRFKIT